jgi:CubicO group peptidase (beta-lactamase class C family)
VPLRRASEPERQAGQKLGESMIEKEERIMRLIILVLFLLAASGWVATANSPIKTSNGPNDIKEFEQFLDRFFAEHMQKEHIPGAAFVFVKDNKVFFKKGYGFANLERQQRVSPDSTIFRIGSISKVFTEDAVIQLADQGKINLHTDVNQYLKRVKVPKSFVEPVTAAHLISHTAGFDEIRPGTQAPAR